jgi:hypothetical protein
VAVTVTAAAPPGTEPRRVVNTVDADLPGATAIDDFEPYGVATDALTGTSSALDTFTVRTDLPETQREDASAETSSVGAAASANDHVSSSKRSPAPCR